MSKVKYMKSLASTGLNDEATPIYELVDPDGSTPLKEKNQYTFSSGSFYNFLLTSYVIQHFIKKKKHLTIVSQSTSEFEYDYDKFEEIITRGSIAFEYNNDLYHYNVDNQNLSSQIRADVSVNKLVDELKHELKWSNPLRGKFVQIMEVNGTHYPVLKKIPEITFSDVIIDKQLKSDIFDNTVYQLKHLDDNNGIILYGEPGVGKSHICSAITNAITKEGFTVCYLIARTDYSMLNEFIEQFVSPCILIFEDIDSFAESRLTNNNHALADFLQFINGIGEREERIIFIATTNYLEKLDKAISNRPMRFNRKFEFKFPSNDEIFELVSLYFGSEIATEFAHLCFNDSKPKGQKFSGAHVKEVQRTAKLLAKKHNKEIKEVFAEAYTLVKNNFSTDLKPFGFN